MSTSIVIYKPSDSSLEIPFHSDLDNRTVWGTQKQISQALGITVQAVGQQVQNFKEQRGDGANRDIKQGFITANDGKTYEVEQYNSTVIAFVGFRAKATDKVVDFQDWVGRLIDDHFKPKSVSGLDALEAIVAELRANENRVKALEDRAAHIEARQNAQDQLNQYFTVRAYATYMGYHVDDPTASKIGRRAKKYCKAHDIHVQMIKDTKFGQIGSYPEDVLKGFFDTRFESVSLWD